MLKTLYYFGPSDQWALSLHNCTNEVRCALILERNCKEKMLRVTLSLFIFICSANFQTEKVRLKLCLDHEIRNEDLLRSTGAKVVCSFLTEWTLCLNYVAEYFFFRAPISNDNFDSKSKLSTDLYCGIRQWWSMESSTEFNLCFSKFETK